MIEFKGLVANFEDYAEATGNTKLRKISSRLRSAIPELRDAKLPAHLPTRGVLSASLADRLRSEFAGNVDAMEPIVAPTMEDLAQRFPDVPRGTRVQVRGALLAAERAELTVGALRQSSVEDIKFNSQHKFGLGDNRIVFLKTAFRENPGKKRRR